MSVSPFWSEVYEEFGPIFYELVGFYERHFNRDPDQLITFDDNLHSSEIIPVYAQEIELPTYIMYLSQLPIVNRLTEIKQLSHTCILFPSASHSRYEHSIGVMYRANGFFDKIKEEAKKLDCPVELSEDDRVIVNCAALLHDIGHPAWGHALDGITGYVVQLLREIGDYLFPPKKLDNALAIYLLTQNEQLNKALSNCANQKIEQEKLRNLLPDIIAQIIMEEEDSYRSNLDFDPLLMKKIHILTTIVGRYEKGPGINADRLDWLLRDAHHANVIVKLPFKLREKYLQLIDLNSNNKFAVGFRRPEYCDIIDDPFKKLMDSVREEIYSAIYEGLERSFTDSLLTRLAYSTINVLHEIGTMIAGNHITARAIMGYLLSYDYLMKEYTNRILHLSNRQLSLFPKVEPVNIFSTKSAGLDFILDNLKCIMHYLRTSHPIQENRTIRGDLTLELSYINVIQIKKTLIMITPNTASKLLEQAAKVTNASEGEKLFLLYHSIVSTSRINATGVLTIPSLESNLQESLDPKNYNHLLVNYYFFRKLGDRFREVVTSFDKLREFLSSKEFGQTPFIFLVIDQKDPSLVGELFDKVCEHLIARFSVFFQALEIDQALTENNEIKS